MYLFVLFILYKVCWLVEYNIIVRGSICVIYMFKNIWCMLKKGIYWKEIIICINSKKKIVDLCIVFGNNN